MILCEVITKSKLGPWNDNLQDITIMNKVCNLNQRPNLPTNCNIFFKQLIRQCWQQVFFLNEKK